MRSTSTSVPLTRIGQSRFGLFDHRLEARLFANRIRERQRIASERQALLDSRRKLLQHAVGSAARSDEIRSLVRALDERISPRIEEVPAFEYWRSRALSEAETIDPQTQSLKHL